MQSALEIKTLYNHRDLLIAWTTRTVKARYQQSVLGGLWAILQPVATAVIFTVIFTVFIPIDTGNVPYIVFVYSAMVPWTFFSTSLVDMVDSLTINMNLVSKIYFPREILPIAALLARMLDFMIAGSVLILLMIYYQVPLFKANWIFLPAIVVVQLMLALGLGFFGSALNVFYRDVKHLVALGLQLWLYATPIIYPTTNVPERFLPFYFLNPMAGIIESYRDVLVRPEMTTLGTYTIDGMQIPYLLPSAIIASVVLFAGYWFFKKAEFQFADVV